MSDSSGFASVKLPAALVEQARDAARPMRRSVAGQIEYWATLGRVAEHTGLSVQEARTAIEGYEAAARMASGKPSGTEPNPQSMDSLEAVKRRVLSVNADGSLQGHVREIVQANRRLTRQRTAA